MPSEHLYLAKNTVANTVTGVGITVTIIECRNKARNPHDGRFRNVLLFWYKTNSGIGSIIFQKLSLFTSSGFNLLHQNDGIIFMREYAFSVNGEAIINKLSLILFYGSSIHPLIFENNFNLL